MSRRSDGRRRGVGLLRKWGRGVLRRWRGILRFSRSEQRRTTPHLPHLRLEERRTPSHLPFSRPEEWTKNLLPGTFSSDPPQRPPARLSYPAIWIFRSVFHLEDRSEDRDRPSTRSSVPKTMTQGFLDLPAPKKSVGFPVLRRRKIVEHHFRNTSHFRRTRHFRRTLICEEPRTFEESNIL